MLVDSTNCKYFFFHIDIAVTQKTLLWILSQDTTHLPTLRIVSFP